MASLSEVLGDAEDAIELDLSGSVGFGTAPYGKYVAKLDRWEQKTSKAGDPMIAWYFQVHETIDVTQWADEANPSQGKAAAPDAGTFLPIVNTMLTGAGAWRTQELYEALGGNMKAKDSAGKTKLSPRSVVGNLVRCVKQQQANDPRYDELTGFEKASGKSALA